jgi:hypothetical protein
MSDDPAAPPPEPPGLQFDRAETRSPGPAAAAPACAACKQPLVDRYFLAGAVKVCAACKDGYEQHLASGSKSSRVLKAVLLGLLAALVGGGIWALVIVKTDSMWGIVAVGMGYLVGIAVRKGSEGRGGRPYQYVAMALAYLSIATGYMGVFISQYLEQKTPAVKTVEAGGPGDSAPAKSDEPRKPMNAKEAIGGCVGACAMLLLVYAGSPLLLAKDNPISLLFLGIALWEAWKLNRGVTIKISGPFALGTAKDPGGAAGG